MKTDVREGTQRASHSLSILPNTCAILDHAFPHECVLPQMVRFRGEVLHSMRFAACDGYASHPPLFDNLFIYLPHPAPQFDP